MSHPLTSRDRVIVRSDGRCESMLKLPRAWTRCGRSQVEVHHALTRARGGDLLDLVGETYHLIALCGDHHRQAHQGVSPGLMIDGSVYRDGVFLVYEGPDDYLRRRFGKEARHSYAVDVSVVS